MRDPRDKANWPPGPWHDEPDQIVWSDVVTGYGGAIIRGPLGHLCGYVGVPSSHPWAGKPLAWFRRVEVHGGITHSSDGSGLRHSGEESALDPALWWVGFDCAHGFDLAPSMASAELMVRAAVRDGDPELPDRMRNLMARYFADVDGRAPRLPREQYRDVAYVRREVDRLMAQAMVAVAEHHRDVDDRIDALVYGMGPRLGRDS